MDRRTFCRLVPGLALLASPTFLASCGKDGGVSVAEARASVDRATPGAQATEDAPALAGHTRGFAWDLYGAFPRAENLFFSPWSISQALAMTYGGARSATADEMANALHFELPGDRLHPAFNALDRALAPGPDDTFRLTVANAAWGQTGHHFEQAYLELLARNYGSGMHLTGFEEDPEAARKAINAWVEDHTEDLIQELLPEGTIDEMTRLVLTNAIYFKATWEVTFEKDRTRPGDFHRLDGSAAEAQFMHRQGGYHAAVTDDLTAIELPYAGGRMAMLVLMPPAGALEAFESTLDAGAVEDAIDRLQPQTVSLALPKFSFTFGSSLKDALRQLGMITAFVPDAADFSSIDGTRALYISDALHKAFVRVDEEGTEAAAATGVIAGVTSAPAQPLRVTIDRPFVFVIRDRETGVHLFAGRVVDPGGM